MNYILFDDETRLSLLPFTYTRPVADIRIGILTIREKWEHFLKSKTSFHTEEFLSEKFPLHSESDNILINGSVLPTEALAKEVAALKQGQKIAGTDSTDAGRTFLIAWSLPSDE